MERAELLEKMAQAAEHVDGKRMERILEESTIREEDTPNVDGSGYVVDALLGALKLAQLQCKTLRGKVKYGQFPPETNIKPFDGCTNLIIAAEELCELAEQVCLTVQGNEDPIGLIEELADVMLSLNWVIKVCNVNTQDVYKAMNVKLDRLEGGYR